ncbi:MAG: DUF1353 domain-containing protein [Gammaproteobacteria bacterium]|nr:DUF1353 domain-containing protein [Gammaproteobacteria bacterium]
MSQRTYLATGLVLLAMSFPAYSDSPADFGRFLSKPQTEWDADGRDMSLLSDFVYEDQHHTRWTAKKGASINGASIPQVFWGIIGGPFEGKYRNASVVHDTECEPPYKHDWRDVHRMFYNASRAGGVPMYKAKTMYMAVYFCGPRWTWNGVKPHDSCFQRDTLIRGMVVLRKNPALSLEAIEAFTPESLASQVTDAELAAERTLLDHDLTKGGNLDLPKLLP